MAPPRAQPPAGSAAAPALTPSGEELARGLRLGPEELRRRCDPARLTFATTAEVTPLEGTVGQERALRALEFGLAVQSPGYNIYASGPTGTGKRTTLETHLQRFARERPTPGDWVYLHSFEQPDRPSAVQVPTGRGRELARDMAHFVEEARRALRRAFESEGYQGRRHEATEELDHRRDEALSELRAFARERDLGLELTPAGLATLPLSEGHPITPQEFQALPERTRKDFRIHGKEVEERATEVQRRMRALERETREQLRSLDHEVALYAVGHLIDELKARYADVPALQDWLDGAREDLIENFEQLQPLDEEQRDGLPAALLSVVQRAGAEHASRYQVNVFVGHHENGGAPVVIEPNPTYMNLFGRIEYDTAFGAVSTDHRHVRPGAVHRANGGYLLLQAVDVLTRPFVWEKLKEVLRTGSARVENVGEQFMLFPVTTLRPEPVELALKVILVGPPQLYRLLYALDEDVRKLLKVRADFDVEVEWTEETEGQYAGFIARQVRENGLRDFDRDAVARVLEDGARRAGHQRRLSTRFVEVANLVAEASHWATAAGSDVVRAEHVERAIDEHVYRSNLVEEKIRQLIAEGTLLIDVENAAPGQVNGIAAIDLGDYTLGRPVRITATTAAGGELLSIDRETELSGPVHDKGFLILRGFLLERYGTDKPLSLAASLVFEQSYEEIEGDSASSAELYALLSSLARAPIRQGIAVTGSVNQHGRIQPVGGLNEKVEGFYAVCKARGLSGEQGVIVPRANVAHLMLREEVVEAVRAGRFHIWAVEAVEEGIELLTGVPAGVRDAEGRYPEGTIHARVESRLAELAEVGRRFQGGRDGAAADDGEQAAG